jgi:hypothetical protein
LLSENGGNGTDKSVVMSLRRGRVWLKILDVLQKSAAMGRLGS